MKNIRLLFVLLPLMLAGCESLNPDLALSASMDVVQASTLTDADVINVARQAAVETDKKNTVAASNSAYTQRLNRLMGKHANEDNLNLNFKVYMAPSVNAFAMADGTIRVHSGLMDKMTDHELLFVLGHEVGHVKKGHSKKSMQVALVSRAARKGLGAVGGTVGNLAASELGELGEQVINAQYSQKDERQADDYGLRFLKRNGYPPTAAVSGLRKLGVEGGGFLSSHPNPQARADRLESKIK